MHQYLINPSNRKDVLINTLCDLLYLRDTQSISKDTIRALIRDLKVPCDDAFDNEDEFIDDIIYWARDNFNTAVSLADHDKRHPPETAESVRQRIKDIKEHYDNLFFWTVVVGVVLLIVALVL